MGLAAVLGSGPGAAEGQLALAQDQPQPGQAVLSQQVARLPARLAELQGNCVGKS